MRNAWIVNISTLLKTGVVLAWALLFVLLLQRDVFITSLNPQQQQTMLQAEREEYQGVYFRDRKIGFVVNRFSPQDNNLQLVDQQAHMNLNVGNTVHEIDLHLKALLNATDVLKSFSFTFESPFYQMTAEGKVEGTQIHFTLVTGNNTITSSLQLEGPPMLPTARRNYLLQQELEEGNKIKVPWFDPVSLTAKHSVVEYRGRERILINGRVHNLHRFIETFGGARVNIWLSEDGDVMKEESPAGFVFIKEPKFKALALDQSSEDLLAAVAVTITGSMPPLEGLTTMRYRLQFQEDAAFDLDSGRQEYNDQVLTIRQESLPGKASAISQPCPDPGDSLDASPYIQADAQEIVSLAEEITRGTVSLPERVQRLADWVYQNLAKRPVLGIPDALTTLANLRGDCNEHAALFAALARAAKIPTRIAAGVMYHKEAFYYHAWNEVCVGGKWITIDTTINQFPADLSHIKFIQGGLQEQVRIGALLGQLTIEPLPAPE